MERNQRSTKAVLAKSGGGKRIMSEFTTVKVYTKTRDSLAKEGKYNESMADIIERMYREWKK